MNSTLVGLALAGVIAMMVLLMINGVGMIAPSRRPRVAEDPEVITGHVARVTSSIGAAASGAIAYTLEGIRHEITAVSLDGRPIQAGADVVIARLDNGLALVEPWEVVEGRI